MPRPISSFCSACWCLRVQNQGYDLRGGRKLIGWNATRPMTPFPRHWCCRTTTTLHASGLQCPYICEELVGTPSTSYTSPRSFRSPKQRTFMPFLLYASPLSRMKADAGVLRVPIIQTVRLGVNVIELSKAGSRDSHENFTGIKPLL